MTATITAIASGDSDPDMNEALRRVRSASAVDPVRIPPHPPRRLDPVTDAWLTEYQRRARRHPRLDVTVLGARVEKHFGGAA